MFEEKNPEKFPLIWTYHFYLFQAILAAEIRPMVIRSNDLMVLQVFVKAWGNFWPSLKYKVADSQTFGVE